MLYILEDGPVRIINFLEKMRDNNIPWKLFFFAPLGSSYQTTIDYLQCEYGAEFEVERIMEFNTLKKRLDEIAKNNVLLANLRTGDELGDELRNCTGSIPLKFSIAIDDAKNVFYYTTFRDGYQIKAKDELKDHYVDTEFDYNYRRRRVLNVKWEDTAFSAAIGI